MLDRALTKTRYFTKNRKYKSRQNNNLFEKQCDRNRKKSKPLTFNQAKNYSIEF